MVGLKVSQRGLLPLGEAAPPRGGSALERLRRQSRTCRGLPHERLTLPLGDKKLISELAIAVVHFLQSIRDTNYRSKKRRYI
jgi:hypothetical protein